MAQYIELGSDTFGDIQAGLRSPSGHLSTSGGGSLMSAIGGKADIAPIGCHVRL